MVSDVTAKTLLKKDQHVLLSSETKLYVERKSTENLNQHEQLAFLLRVRCLEYYHKTGRKQCCKMLNMNTLTVFLIYDVFVFICLIMIHANTENTHLRRRL